MRYNKVLAALLLFLFTFPAFCQAPYKGRCPQKKLFLEGNSLMNWSINHGVINGRYVSTGIYNSVRSGRTIALVDYGTSSQNQTEINAAAASRLVPYLNTGDVVFIWEGTNDMYTNDLSGEDAFDNLIEYVNILTASGAEVIVGTVIARDYVSDDVDLMTRIGAYNTLVRDNAATYNYTVCDLAALTQFDARADCANTTYYHSDKLHIVQAGQDLIISTASTSVINVLDD